MFDASQVHALAARLAASSAAVAPALLPVANVAANKMKAGMQQEASGHRRLSGLPAAVEYQVEPSPTSVTVTVGFRNEGQGALAFIGAYGTAKTAPFMDIGRPLRDEAPAAARFAGQAVAKALRL